MNAQEIRDTYTALREGYLVHISKRLEVFLTEAISSSRIDRVVVRAKAIESFTQKAMTLHDGKLKYSEPFQQIQDQIGARIIVYYKSDISEVEKLLQKTLRHIERRDFIEEKNRSLEFGYEGVHYIFSLPTHVLPDNLCGSSVPDFFELQIKTLFQHAWSQAEHDLTYKPNTVWNSDEKKYIKFIAAQAWAADELFDKLFKDHHIEN